MLRWSLLACCRRHINYKQQMIVLINPSEQGQLPLNHPYQSHIASRMHATTPFIIHRNEEERMEKERVYNICRSIIPLYRLLWYHRGILLFIANRLVLWYIHLKTTEIQSNTSEYLITLLIESKTLAEPKTSTSALASNVLW